MGLNVANSDLLEDFELILYRYKNTLVPLNVPFDSQSFLESIKDTRPSFRPLEDFELVLYRYKKTLVPLNVPFDSQSFLEPTKDIRTSFRPCKHCNQSSVCNTSSPGRMV